MVVTKKKSNKAAPPKRPPAKATADALPAAAEVLLARTADRWFGGLSDDPDAQRVVAVVAKRFAGDSALRLELRCDPDKGHGVHQEDFFFVLVVTNVTPLQFQLELAEITSLSVWDGVEVLVAGPADARSVVELAPGGYREYEFTVPHRKATPGGQLADKQALSVTAKVKISMQGPTSRLCTDVTRRVRCWMPCRGGVRW